METVYPLVMETLAAVPGMEFELEGAMAAPILSQRITPTIQSRSTPTEREEKAEKDRLCSAYWWMKKGIPSSSK